MRNERTARKGFLGILLGVASSFFLFSCSQPAAEKDSPVQGASTDKPSFRVNFNESNSGSVYIGTSVSGAITPSKGDKGKSASLFVWIVGVGGKRNYLRSKGVWVNELDSGGPIAFDSVTLDSSHSIDIHPESDLSSLAKSKLNVNIGYGFGSSEAFDDMINNSRYSTFPVPAPRTAVLGLTYSQTYNDTTYVGTTTVGSVTLASGDVGNTGAIYVWIVGVGGKRNYLKPNGEWINEQDSGGPVALISGALNSTYSLNIFSVKDIASLAQSNLQITVGYGIGSDPFTEMMDTQRHYSKPIPLPSGK